MKKNTASMPVLAQGEQLHIVKSFKKDIALLLIKYRQALKVSGSTALIQRQATLLKYDLSVILKHSESFSVENSRRLDTYYRILNRFITEKLFIPLTVTSTVLLNHPGILKEAACY